MKRVSLLRRVMTMVIALCVFSTFAFADGETTEVFLTGSSNSAAGDFVVQTTSDMFHFQGREYEVYRVYYDDRSPICCLIMKGPTWAFSSTWCCLLSWLSDLFWSPLGCQGDQRGSRGRERRAPPYGPRLILVILGSGMPLQFLFFQPLSFLCSPGSVATMHFIIQNQMSSVGLSVTV